MNNILFTKRILCRSCMETHDVQIVEDITTNIFKGIRVKYPAKYYYCDRTEEFYCDEEMLAANDTAMKNAYRKAKGLLTSEEIIAIRQKYDITQKDLCLLLGWGEKTITRYESHQVQDFAHNSILRKIDDDPAWFLVLLDAAIQNQTIANADKYRENAKILFAEKHRQYLNQALTAYQLFNQLQAKFSSQ